MDTESWNRSVKSAITVLLVLVIGGAWLALQFVNFERERVWQEWQVRLGLLADTRSNLIQSWTTEQFQYLHRLAGNPSMQLYLAQLTARGNSSERGTEPAQLSYLRNLIRSAALRGEFGSGAPSGKEIPANITAYAGSGLLLLDAEATPIVATTGLPKPDKGTLSLARKVLKDGQHEVRNLYINEGGEPVMGFLVPIQPLAGASGKPVGVLIGIKSAHEGLYPLLRQEGLSLASEETLLVQRKDNLLLYLSPLTDGGEALKRSLAFAPDKLASAYAVENPGSFNRLTDYTGKPVLVTSRALQNLPWTLVQKVAEEEALADFKEHRNSLVVTLTLLLAIFAALLVAAWQHGSSLRARISAGELGRRNEELQSQWELLAAITDNIGEMLLLVDSKGRFVFVNKQLADLKGLNRSDFSGKTLTSALGPDTATQVGQLIYEAHVEEQGILATTRELELGGTLRTYHLVVLPISWKSSVEERVLIVAHDVTDLLDEQRRQYRLMNQLVSVLLRLIDLHDPHCIDHSIRTARVAVAVARAMELREDKIQSLSMAARLANLGKIFVPRELLLKQEELTEQDLKLMREGEKLAQKTLKQIEFDGPVAEIIAQKREHMDGSGTPKGLHGGEILIGARILAVANAYVAMTSSRAYREGMEMEEALDALLQDASTCFDRRVVSALFHIAENHPDLLAISENMPLPSGISGRPPLK